MSKKKKKKVRVAFRKNRQKSARSRDLTRRVLEDHVTEEQTELTDMAIGERISGKGELTRHRTVIGVESETDDGQVLIDVDESICQPGRVISAVGLNCVVQAEDGRRFECTTRRVVRTLARDGRNAVVTGDHVLFQQLDDDYGVIERVNARIGVLSRGSGRQEHIIVANIDQVVIIASAADPPLKPNLIDRFLISAEKGDVRAVVCINKVDLIDPAELQSVAGLYGRLGYEVVLTSAEQNTGIARLRWLLQDRESVLAGQSGVGKSSLLNAIQPGLRLSTGDVSDWSRKGRHTTRRAELMQLKSGGWVIDTPGIRQMQLWDVIAEEVEGFFVEFRPWVRYCKFPNCSHTHEDGCGVKTAVDRDFIARARYESYLKIVLADR